MAFEKHSELEVFVQENELLCSNVLFETELDTLHYFGENQKTRFSEHCVHYQSAKAATDTFAQMGIPQLCKQNSFFAA